MTGLPENHSKTLIDVLRQFPSVDAAAYFGSRAKGNAEPGSDVDIALYGAAISSKDLWRIKYQLEEGTTLPYFFDLVPYEQLANEALKAHIDRVARFFYDRNNFTPLPRIDPLLR